MSDQLNEFLKNYSKQIQTNKVRKNTINNNAILNKELPSTDFTTKNLVIIVDNSSIDINENSQKIQKFSSEGFPDISSSTKSPREYYLNTNNKIKINHINGNNFLGRKKKDLTDETKINKNSNFSQNEKKNLYLNEKIGQNKIENKNVNALNINNNKSNNLRNISKEVEYDYKINIDEVELLHQTIEYKNKPFYNHPFDIINQNEKMKNFFMIK